MNEFCTSCPLRWCNHRCWCVRGFCQSVLWIVLGMCQLRGNYSTCPVCIKPDVGDPVQEAATSCNELHSCVCTSFNLGVQVDALKGSQMKESVKVSNSQLQRRLHDSDQDWSSKQHKGMHKLDHIVEVMLKFWSAWSFARVIHPFLQVFVTFRRPSTAKPLIGSHHRA